MKSQPAANFNISQVELLSNAFDQQQGDIMWLTTEDKEAMV